MATPPPPPPPPPPQHESLLRMLQAGQPLHPCQMMPGRMMHSGGAAQLPQAAHGIQAVSTMPHISGLLGQTTAQSARLPSTSMSQVAKSRGLNAGREEVKQGESHVGLKVRYTQVTGMQCAKHWAMRARN